MGLLLAILIVGTILWNIFERHRHRRMAAERTPLTEHEFVSQMVARGVQADTARYVWLEAAHYYFDPLKPDPADRWETTMRIDPEDLEDITAKFWKQQGWIDPNPSDPVVLPTDPSLLEYGSWLDRQRQVQR